jgi:hypothetical protein
MITLVTGLWDIGRGDLKEGWSRNFDFYLERFRDILKIDCNLIIFGDEELHKFVLSENRDKTKTKFITRNLDWFRNNEYFEKIQNIRKDPKWFNQVGWLKDSTQSTLEMYNPLVMSKMFLLHDAMLLDPFNSEKLYWIDAGITNTVNLGYFTNDDVLSKIDKLLNNFTFLAFPYETDTEIHGFSIKGMTDYIGKKPDMVCRGGFFGGPKHLISEMNVNYYQTLISTLSDGYMGTEESIFTILTYNLPTIIDFCKIDSNGLVYKFFEDIKNNQVVIENTSVTKFEKKPISYSGGVGLYVITFNSPKQFEVLIESMLEYDPSFLSKTKKFLLDNSTDLTTSKEYKNLCSLYDFEHIKKNNIGITGGRQFIAEHFNQQDDLDTYYFFEDDMAFYKKDSGVCKNGFSRYIKHIFDITQEIIKKENFDFLKLNFTEFFGSHDKQWAWYNVPQTFREKHWPKNKSLPKQGLDPNSPNLEFKHIKSHRGLAYASGEIYLSNWPILMTKNGNYNCYLKTKFKNPYEQTLMSHCYQETIKGNIFGSVLLLTPTEHNRFDFYDSKLRKEC